MAQRRWPGGGQRTSLGPARMTRRDCINEWAQTAGARPRPLVQHHHASAGLEKGEDVGAAADQDSSSSRRSHPPKSDATTMQSKR